MTGIGIFTYDGRGAFQETHRPLSTETDRQDKTISAEGSAGYQQSTNHFLINKAINMTVY